MRAFDVASRTRVLTVLLAPALLVGLELSLPQPGAVAQIGPTPMPTINPPPINIPGTFAAVASDRKGRLGASIHSGGSLVAHRDAVRRCGGSGCEVMMLGAGRCVAVAQSLSGGFWIGFAHGNNRGRVQQIAMEGCTKGAPAGTCRLEHVNCL